MNFFECALSLLFPNTCGICGKINEKAICEECYTKIKKMIHPKIDNYLQDNTKHFTEHAYLFSYEGIIREKILQYKFYDKAYLAEMFFEILIKNEKICGFLKKYDIIMSVPISRERLKQRGYNQSELIAKKIGKKTAIIYENVLIKQTHNLPQSTLTKTKRIQNVKGAYQLKNEPIIKEKNILIFDDIYTTGSTANECAKMLKQVRSSASRNFNNCKRQSLVKNNKGKEETNGRFSGKHFRLCSSRLYRLCHYD